MKVQQKQEVPPRVNLMSGMIHVRNEQGYGLAIVLQNVNTPDLL